MGESSGDLIANAVFNAYSAMRQQADFVHRTVAEWGNDPAFQARIHELNLQHELQHVEAWIERYSKKSD